jgi:glutaminase
VTTERYVSTGALPGPDQVKALVEEAHRLFADVRTGATSSVYPALETVDPSLFGVCVAGVSGRLYEAGDSTVPFPVMSVAKPFAFALVCAALGPDAARELLGVNATGLPFNSIEALERGEGHTNPMVNPGAIATVSLIPAGSPDERWDLIQGGLSGFAGRRLEVDEDIYRSATATNFRNRELVAALDSHGAIHGDPMETLDLYTRMCSIAVTARDLAVMGATLANDGANPRTGEPVVAPGVSRHVLVVMATAGLYETSGDWLYEVGLPAKSGIGGGIVTVSPGKGGLGAFSPPLDPAGNSVRGQLVAGHLSRRLGLDLFAAQPYSGA